MTYLFLKITLWLYIYYIWAVQFHSASMSCHKICVQFERSMHQMATVPSLPPIIIAVWLPAPRCHEKGRLKSEQGFHLTFFFWLAPGSHHQDHVGSSSQALALLGARASVAPHPLTEMEIRAGWRGIQGGKRKPEKGLVIYILLSNLLHLL